MSARPARGPWRSTSAGRVVAEARRPYRTARGASGLGRAGSRATGARCRRRRCAAWSVALPSRSGVAAIGLTGQCPTVAPVRSRRPAGRPGHALPRQPGDRRGGRDARCDRRGGDASRAPVTSPTAFHVGPKLLWLRSARAASVRAARTVPAAARRRPAAPDRARRDRRDPRQRDDVLRPARAALGRRHLRRGSRCRPRALPGGAGVRGRRRRQLPRGRRGRDRPARRHPRGDRGSRQPVRGVRRRRGRPRADRARWPAPRRASTPR